MDATLTKSIIALHVAAGMSRDEAAQAAISVVIGHGVKQGIDVRVMFDEVLGAGAYERMAGDLYHALRAKVA